MNPSMYFMIPVVACGFLFQGCEKQALTPEETTSSLPTTQMATPATSPPSITTPTAPPPGPGFKTKDMIVSAEIVSIIDESGGSGLQERLEHHLKNRAWVKSFEVSSHMVSYTLEDDNSTYRVQIP